MVCSIVLLLVLQAFWLRSAYRDAASQFRKETNFLFRNTVFAMQDSMIQRGIEPMMASDTLQKRGPLKQFFIRDSVQLRTQLPADCVFNYVNISEKTARIQIIASGTPADSIQHILRPLAARLQKNSKEPKSFILRLSDDSLSADSIHYYYEQALDRAGIPARFHVLTFRGHPRSLAAPVQDEFVSEIVPATPVNRYAVSFMGIESLLLKEITPQIFFSIFLTTLTIASFYVMYRSLRTQERLMEIKNDFISNVTHELKTPVATVSVALEAIRNFHVIEDPKRTVEYLEIAQNELSRLTLMTDKILKTSVFENRGLELRTETIAVDELINEILTSMKLIFEKRNVTLRYRKEGSSFTLEGSREHLTNVLYNLLDNALKYGGDSVDILLTEQSDSLTFTVSDNGPGIPTGYRKKIFEKFFRIPSGDVHAVKGYGLGLSYVASVVKHHGGAIVVAGEPGKGSSFVVTLPRQANDHKPGSVTA
jgi:two-component system phosphate regulon sensor histidine kinase PhoR